MTQQDRPVLYRSFVPEDLQIRASGDGRTLYGMAVPYGRPQRIDRSLTEQFRAGAFNRQLNAAFRIPLAFEHLPLGGKLIGRTVSLKDDPAGLIGEWRVAATRDGDDALALIEVGALPHFSIGFRERKNATLPGGITERVQAELLEVAVTREGAYGDAASIAGVRSALDGDDPDDALEQVRALLAELPEDPRAALSAPAEVRSRLEQAEALLSGLPQLGGR